MITAIERAVDPGLLVSAGAQVIGENHVGEIAIELSQPLAADPYTVDTATGRIVLELDGRIAGGGLILAAQTAAAGATSGPRPDHVAPTARLARTGVNSDELRAKAAALAHVAATRAGQGGVSGVENKQTLRKFVIDFKGDTLAGRKAEDLDAVATLIGSGKVVFSAVSDLPETGAMRLAIDAEVDGKDAVELRAYLVGGGKQLTETWLYQWRSA